MSLRSSTDFSQSVVKPNLSHDNAAATAADNSGDYEDDIDPDTTGLSENIRRHRARVDSINLLN